MKPLPKQSGFTLIEVTVSVALFALLAYGVIALVGSMITTSNQQGILLDNQDQARKVTSSFTSEIRNAVTSNTGAYSLDTAGDQSIIFYTNVNGGAAIERIRYYISNGALYKGVVVPTGSPLAYNLGSEQVTKVLANVANGATPLFYYYPDTYTGVNNNFLTQPVNVTQVKFVKMSVQIYNKGAKAGTTNTYTVTAGATIRNLKTNLGN